MSSLLFLTVDDFYLHNEVYSYLCTNIRGISLVLFYSTQCPHCQSLIPLYKNLPDQISGCQFAMLNVSTPLNRKIVSMSKTTVSPIEYVPYIIMYVNGRPHMRYDGPKSFDEIRKFIFAMSKAIQNKLVFTENVSQADKRKIPEYTIGVPLSEGRYYLEYDEAYGK